MRTIYIDEDFKCYTEPAEGRTVIETDVFDGKCAAYIEGCRFVPQGSVWTRDNGVVFEGEMISPWVDSRELERVQAAYEREQLEEYKTALVAIETALGVNV